jgi:hypothetical protein
MASEDMTKLLIFIGEGQTFDVEVTIDAISAMRGVTDSRRGNFVGSVLSTSITTLEQAQWFV